MKRYFDLTNSPAKIQPLVVSKVRQFSTTTHYYYYYTTPSVTFHSVVQPFIWFSYFSYLSTKTVSDVLDKRKKNSWINSALWRIHCIKSSLCGDIVACVFFFVIIFCLSFNLATAVLRSMKIIKTLTCSYSAVFNTDSIQTSLYYEAYVDQCPVTCCSRLSWRWCSPGSTTAQRLLLVCRSSSWTDFSLCRRIRRRMSERRTSWQS